MDTKLWWQSRTIWLQIVAAVFALLGALKILPAGIDQEQVVSVIMAGVALATALMRLRTAKAIAPRTPPAG